MAKQKVLIQPRIVRIIHWLLVLGITTLLISGLYIHNPILTAPYINLATAQYIQFGTAFIVTGIVAVRIYYGIITGDYKNILFRLSEVKQFIGLMKYYFFLQPKEPYHEKYNAGQKLIFTSWLVAFMFQLYSGLIMYYPVWANNHPFVGQLQTLRFYHYLVAIWFLVTLPVHLYLVFTGDPGRLQAIFTGWTRVAKQDKTHQKPKEYQKSKTSTFMERD